MRRIIAAIAIFFVYATSATAQGLQADGWQWLEIENTGDLPNYAARRAQELRIEFPQAASIRTTTGYAIIVGFLRNSVAERTASELLKETIVGSVRLNSGSNYVGMLSGVYPFDQNRTYSLGFPSAPIANSNAPYIQVASRISFTQAIRIAKQLTETGNLISVMLTKNGWYSVVIDRNSNNRSLLDPLKSSKKIPSDATLTNGQAYDEIIWKSDGLLDPRLVASYPTLKYSSPQDALSAGYGLAALELLIAEYDRSGSTDFILAYDILAGGLGSVKKDPILAFKWLNLCEIVSSVKCLYELGLAYDAGFGVTKDTKRAVTYYAKCAELLVPKCQKRLGIKKILGEDTIQDFLEGVKLLEASAVSGDPDAASVLGVTLMAGLAGYQQPLKAYFWLILAANNLPAGKEKDESVKFRNDVVKTLSGATVVEIQNAAKQWQPGQPAPSFLELPTGAKAQGDIPKPREAKTTGTGFYINKFGHIVTNAHVVDGCKTIKILDEHKVEVTSKVKASDLSNDLAIVQTEAPSPNYFKLRPDGRLGEPISAFGFPLSGVLATGGNFTTGNITALSGLKDDSRHFQISAPVQPGNSGGPMFDETGNVLGVVVGKANALAIAAAIKDIPQNVNFAIKSSVLIEFLKTYGIIFDTSSSNTPRAAADIATIAKKGSIFIECHK